MKTRITQAFSLSDEVMARVKAITDRASVEPELADKLQLRSIMDSPDWLLELRTDNRNLTPEDYKAIQGIARSQKTGDELIAYAILPPIPNDIRQRTQAYIRQAQKRNRRAKARAGRVLVNTSRVVEALLRLAIQQVSAAEKVDAPVKSGAGARRNVRKIA